MRVNLEVTGMTQSGKEIRQLVFEIESDEITQLISTMIFKRFGLRLQLLRDTTVYYNGRGFKRGFLIGHKFVFPRDFCTARTPKRLAIAK